MTTSQALTGLPPVIAPGARLLILGSMPGTASLARGEYYAHPRNAFWDLIEHRLGIPRAAPYPQRLASLTQHGIALWDVAAHCRRRGSLDSAIEHATVVPNDFAELFRAHPTIGAVGFNGRKAAALYRRLVLPLGRVPDGLVYHDLPSTSPANTTRPVVEKRREWDKMLSAL